MIVCVCHRVSDRDIARAVQGGCASFVELQFDLSVATSCGKCHDCACATFDHHARQAGAPAAAPVCGAGSNHGQEFTSPLRASIGASAAAAP